MPYVSMATQAGAKHWACRICNVLGVRVSHLDCVVYVDAARQLSQLPGHLRTAAHRRLLTEWKRRFRHTPQFVARLETPNFRRDHAFRMRAGRIAEEAKLRSKAAHTRARIAGGYLGLGIQIHLSIHRLVCLIIGPSIPNNRLTYLHNYKLIMIYKITDKL
jgi:hypothetical protein